MLSKERKEESFDLICKELVKSHQDKDDDSLYIRFCEIIQDYREVDFMNKQWDNVCNIIVEERLKNINKQ